MPFILRDEREPGAVWPAITIGIFAAFGGVLFGYDTGTISGIQTMPFWQKQFDINPTQDAGRISLIVSVLSIGTFVGALSAGYLADWVGRKYGILLSALIPFNLGVILQTAATEQSTFIVGRFFAGLGVGLISLQIPMYQSETLPKWIRGAVVGCYQWFITIGLLVASLVNYATENRDDSGSYRIPLAVQFAWSIIIIVGMFFLPETPRFLVKKGKPERAAKSLSTLRRLPADGPEVQAELQSIQADYEKSKEMGSASWTECFRGNVGKRVATGILLQSLQQLVGINFIFYLLSATYMLPGVGTKAGVCPILRQSYQIGACCLSFQHYYGVAYFSSHSSQLPQLPSAFLLGLITNLVNTISTVPGLFAIDRFGRRPVLLTGAIGMGVCQYIVAACGKATEISNYPSAAAQLAFICIYIAFFAATWGPAAWVVTGEIFPLKVRAKGLSLTTAANWFFNWLLAFITPYLVTSLNPTQSNVFWIWGSFCWLGAIFVFSLIYETKGLSLEQVSVLYEIESKAWRSASRHQELNAMFARDHEVRLNSIISVHGGEKGDYKSDYKGEAEHSE